MASGMAGAAAAAEDSARAEARVIAAFEASSAASSGQSVGKPLVHAVAEIKSTLEKEQEERRNLQWLQKLVQETNAAGRRTAGATAGEEQARDDKEQEVEEEDQGAGRTGLVAGTKAAAVVARLAALRKKMRGTEEEEERNEPTTGATATSPASAPSIAARLASRHLSMSGWGGQEEEDGPSATAARAGSDAVMTEKGKEQEDKGKQKLVDVEKEAGEEGPLDLDSFLLEGAPADYICPLSLCLLEDAVIAMDGITYSRASIQARIDFCHEKGKLLTSPMMGESTEGMLVNSVMARRMVSEYVQAKKRELEMRGGKKE